MKKNLITLSVSLFLACFVAGLIEKFMYPNEIFNIKQGIIEICTFFLVFIIFIVSIKDKKTISKRNFIKILFPIGITIYVSIFYCNIYYLLFGLLEIFIIFIITNLFNNKKTSYIMNSLLLLLYNFQVALLIFSGSFLRRIMLSNLTSIEDISGNLIIYVTSAILIVIFSFLPTKKILLDRRKKVIFTFSLVLLELLIIIFSNLVYSPIGNYFVLAKEEIDYYKNIKILRANAEAAEALKESFHSKEVLDYRKYDNSLGENPNIILIFTEGLSQNVISDKRNIMKNIKEYQEKSINFTGYYNHSFATYRGIIGQLYSGYQYNNFDENHLPSIQSILKDFGYTTCFINSEPTNSEFTTYINSFGFDNIITSDKTNGMIGTVSDKDNYELLLSTANDLNNKQEPFFISTYTFGTHVSLDSPDKIYKNGTESLLNRFYNVDYYFGEFIKNFENSKLYDNTIIVFTTDHCTFIDFDYTRLFGDFHERVYNMVDDIPLFIYHKNIDSKNIDVNGRNSLSLVPTILDYIDISAPNYFLGKSLFSGADDYTIYEHIYHDDINFRSTYNKIVSIDEKEIDQNIMNSINDYLSFCSK